MAFEEKSAWLMGVLAVATYSVYLAIVLIQAQTVPLWEVDYAAPLLWAIGASIVASIVLHIVLRAVSPKTAGQKDTRDREIYRFGEYVGNGALIAGALAAMIMAMLQLDYFWIANMIYLAFTVSAILGTIAKVVAYRGGMPSW